MRVTVVPKLIQFSVLLPTLCRCGKERFKNQSPSKTDTISFLFHAGEHLEAANIRRQKCRTIQDSDWADKLTAIADEIEELREDYHTCLHQKWIKNIDAAYPPGSKRLSVDSRAVQKKMVVEVDDT